MERLAHPCGCTQVPVFGAKRPKLCEHGNLFEKVREDGASKPRRRPMKHTEPKRDWTDARAKVELEARCRVCGIEEERASLAAAHVIGRKCDERSHSGTRTLYVSPLRIVPLCVPCHQSYDAHRLDLLPYLALEEQAKAVEDAGSIESARRRISPGSFAEVSADAA